MKVSLGAVIRRVTLDMSCFQEIYVHIYINLYMYIFFKIIYINNFEKECIYIYIYIYTKYIQYI